MPRVSDVELREEKHPALKNGSLLHFKGKIDASNADQVLGRIKNIINSGDIYLIADFTAVHSINSAGLATLLQVTNHAREKGGSFIICKANKRVIQLVDLIGARTLLDLSDSIDQAIASCA